MHKQRRTPGGNNIGLQQGLTENEKSRSDGKQGHAVRQYLYPRQIQIQPGEVKHLQCAQGYQQHQPHPSRQRMRLVLIASKMRQGERQGAE